MATEDDCIAALREAAERLGESPTEKQYEELDIVPPSTTVCRYLGSWNAARERAGLETYGYGKNGGVDVQPKPENLDLPEGEDWEDLSAQQRWYYKNCEWRKEVKNRGKAPLRRWLYEFKRDACECCRCGESHPAALDFHHVGEKTMSISRMVNHGFSRESILEEIDACIVVCANCHRKEHYEIPDVSP